IPPVHICQARVVRVPGHHAPDRCAVVVSIPLSEHRPHWSNQNGREVAYIRAGEHSLPMKLQTLLDISSHGIAPLGAIVDIGVLGYEMRGGQFHFTLNPLIRLENGPMCERWMLELSVDPTTGAFMGGGNGRVIEPNKLIITSTEPLFPRRATRAGSVNFFLN